MSLGEHDYENLAASKMIYKTTNSALILINNAAIIRGTGEGGVRGVNGQIIKPYKLSLKRNRYQRCHFDTAGCKGIDSDSQACRHESFYAERLFLPCTLRRGTA